MALGLGFGFGFGRISGGLVLLVSLAWDDDATDNRPDFAVTLPSGVVANDVLRLQYSSNGGSSWSAYLTHTITAGEVAGDPITVSGVSPLSNRSYLFRARLERGAKLFPWSASEAVTVNASTARNVILVMRAR